ncbi:hypothetical protein LTR86_010957 [Recurvomyces mirabilis]|nr:hypothetical protein LTR86_010957 [Recurvomyces mirabilis]
MVDGELIAYSVASFVCALFVLEFGADKFIDHTTIVANRTGIPQGVIALLTARAEWEELAIVAISVARHCSSLALGNIVGSTISNILGAFSLGLLFHRNGNGKMFDRSWKIYSGLLLVLTTLIASLTGFAHAIKWRVVGIIAIAVFAIYVVSIAWTIYKGPITAPEASDNESSDNEDDDDTPRREDAPTREVRGTEHPLKENGAADEEQHGNKKITADAIEPLPVSEGVDTVRTPAPYDPGRTSSLARKDTDVSDNSAGSNDHSLTYHLALLIVGILAVILSAYVLSHAASTLVNESGMSDIVFGVVILSLATTVPEKFMAVVSGYRGQMGIMVANTVGSNIFLLTLCVGVLWVSTDGNYNQGSVKPAEIGVMFGSAVVMNLTVWFGSAWARYIGAGFLAAYVAFLVLEFTVIHHV